MRLTERFSVLLIACLVALVVKSTDGCSCFPMHPQAQFCESEFVMRVRVLKKIDMEPSGETVYEAKVNRTFKMSNPNYEIKKLDYLYTPNMDSMCGVNLDIGKVYVVSGKIYDGKLRLTLCNLVTRWKEVTKRQRQGFKALYAKGCNKCKVKYTSFKNKGKLLHEAGGTLCPWEDGPGPMDCQEKHGICLLMSDKTCSWQPSKNYNSCIENHQKGRKVTRV